MYHEGGIIVKKTLLSLLLALTMLVSLFAACGTKPAAESSSAPAVSAVDTAPDSTPAQPDSPASIAEDSTAAPEEMLDLRAFASG